MIDLDAIEREARTFSPHRLPDCGEVLALVRVARAAMELCGVDADGTQYAAADEHGDLIREHLIPALEPFRPGDS